MKNIPSELVKEHTDEVVIDITMELFKKNTAELREFPPHLLAVD